VLEQTEQITVMEWWSVGADADSAKMHWRRSGEDLQDFTLKISFVGVLNVLDYQENWWKNLKKICKILGLGCTVSTF